MERELRDCLGQFLVKIGLKGVEVIVYSVATPCILYGVKYRVRVLGQYGGLVALGSSSTVEVWSVRELESYFDGWEDRRDILGLLGVCKDKLFWDVDVFRIKKKGGHYVIYFVQLNDSVVVEKLIDGLRKFGLCGEGFFKLPVDGFREIIGLIR